MLARLLFTLLVFAVTAATAVACLTKAPTTLSTSLSGGGKEGAEITVSEGTTVKDQATLSGKNSAEATGTIKYAVYSDSKCEKLVTSAGESSFTKGKVPASEEKKLEAGAIYHWQAVYSGDSIDEGSTSPCNEVLTVKANTTLSTSLSGGEKEGAKIIIKEEAEVKDQATLSGTNSSSAGGVVKYKVYKDKECKELATGAGEGEVEKGKAPASSGVTLSTGVYYWQAIYEGDSLHEKSTGACGSEVEEVLPLTTLCKANETPCAAAKIWPAGEIRMASELGVPSRFVFSFNGVEKKVKCATSVIEGAMSTRAAWPLRGRINTLGIGSCEEDCLECSPCTVATEDLPYYVEMDATGSGDGAMTMRIFTNGPPRMTVACIGFTCIYEISSLAALEASIEGGEPATLVVNTSLDKLQFGSTEGCGAEVHWTAKDNFTKPNEGVNKMWVVRDGV